MGQPMLLNPVPTGYAEAADAWTSSGALLARMNTASAAAADRLPGVDIDLDRVFPEREVEPLLAKIDARLFGGRGSSRTLTVIRRQIGDEPDPDLRRALALALALGSPDFQRQ